MCGGHDLLQRFLSNLLQFDITVFDDKNDKQPIRDLVRKDLTPLLRKKLACFSKDLIDGKHRHHY